MACRKITWQKVIKVNIWQKVIKVNILRKYQTFIEVKTKSYFVDAHNLRLVTISKQNSMHAQERCCQRSERQIGTEDGLRCLLTGCTSRYHIITIHKAVSFKLIQKLQHPRLSQPLAQTYQVVFMPCHIHVCHTQIIFMLSHILPYTATIHKIDIQLKKASPYANQQSRYAK